MARKKKRDPEEDPRTPREWADYHYKHRDYKQAAEEYRRYVDPVGQTSDLRCIARLASSLRELGQLVEAANYYEHGIRLHALRARRQYYWERELRKEYILCLRRMGMEPLAVTQESIVLALDAHCDKDFMEAVKKGRPRS